MKKLIALALVAVMLVAMSVSVLATESVEAVPCAADSNPCDGIINEGEWGAPVTHLTSDVAYDDDSEDEIAGCQSYVKYQGVDPYAMDAYLYLSWSAENKDRLYFCVDMNTYLNSGVVTGTFNGLAGEDHWSDDSIQWRASADVAATDDVTLDNGALWGSKTFNIILAAYTKDCNGGVMVDGDVAYGGSVDQTNACGAVVSACDHCLDRADLYNSGMFAGSIGVHGTRIHFESILKTAYFASGTDLEVLDIGDKFACSFIVFHAQNNQWCGMLTWGHGISGYNTGLGKTGTNEVVIAAAPVVTTTDNGQGGATGDALVVVVATAIMALGTAVIVKKVK